MSGEASEPSCSDRIKRRKSYNVIEKLHILNELDDSKSSTSEIARKYDIDSRNLRRWRQQRSSLEEFAQKNYSLQRKRQRELPYENMEKALAVWFAEIRERSIPINGPIVQAKAMELATEMNISENFVASSGWLQNWKARYGIHSLAVCGEKSSMDVEAARKFKKDIAVNLKGLTLAQIFNADETGLYYKMLPNQTVVGSEEQQATGYKKFKDRVTIVLCANADGSLKLPLMVISNKKSGWKNANIFEEWYTEEFIPKVTAFLKEKQLPLKAVLILNNALYYPSNEKLSTNEIKIYYLPPNTTSLIQPMDQGIIEVLKRHYWSQLLHELLNALKDANCNVKQFLKTISIKDVIYWISASWDYVQEDVIVKCWKKLLPATFLINKEEKSLAIPANVSTETLLEEIYQIPGYQGITRNEMENWIFKNDNVSLEMPSNEQIIKMASNNYESENKNEEEDHVTPEKALSAVNTLINYYKKKKLLTPEQFTVLEMCQNDLTNSID